MSAWNVQFCEDLASYFRSMSPRCGGQVDLIPMALKQDGRDIRIEREWVAMFVVHTIDVLPAPKEWRRDVRVTPNDSGRQHVFNLAHAVSNVPAIPKRVIEVEYHHFWPSLIHLWWGRRNEVTSAADLMRLN